MFRDLEDGEPVFNRTVSANLGMSYSISNVLASATLPNILRWVPFEIDEVDLRNRIGNKMIRPTTDSAISGRIKDRTGDRTRSAAPFLYTA
ncbi:MAG: glutamate mutase L [Candidatus Marinimicrobia bacterium]|nr:glutamate mutase L [Candidatus Neomarinimicrobiota bacterium]